VKQKVKSKYLPSDLLLRDPLENAIQRRRQASEEEEDLAEGWKITKEMMDKMDNCEWLQSELEDGGLRQIIHQVCDSSNAVAHGQNTHQEVSLEQAKAKYPNFGRFMDKLLVLTGVLERQELQDDEELDDWLKRENDEELGPLALVPIPCRKKRKIETPIRDEDDTDTYSGSSDESESDKSKSSGDSSTGSEDNT
jgi:hypothetical protein